METAIQGFIKNAKILSDLDGCTIWSLFSIVLAAYVFWEKRDQMKKESAWLLIREKQIEGMTAMTEVMKQQTSEISELKMMITKFLIKE